MCVHVCKCTQAYPDDTLLRITGRRKKQRPLTPLVVLIVVLMVNHLQGTLRDLVKEFSMPVTSTLLYEDWKPALEEKAGERLSKIEESFL